LPPFHTSKRIQSTYTYCKWDCLILFEFMKKGRREKSLLP
jgi:hypothetical protein